MKREYVYVSKEEYTETNNENIRLTAENIELNIELQRKDNIINELKKYINIWYYEKTSAEFYANIDDMIPFILDKLENYEKRNKAL